MRVMNIDYKKLSGKDSFDILCEYAEELNSKMSDIFGEIDKNREEELIRQSYQKLLPFYYELNDDQKVTYLQAMLNLADYFNKEQLDLLLSSGKLDGIDTEFIKTKLILLQEKELEVLLQNTSYSRNEIMAVVYEKVNAYQPLSNQEINQWAGNHWNKVTDFFDKAFKLDMNEYKAETALYSIPIIDAVIIMAYTYMILDHKSSELIHKLVNKNYKDINAYELDYFIKLFTDLLKKECKKKLSMHIDSKILKNNIDYVKDRMNRCIRNRDTELYHLESANKLLEEYYNDIEKADVEFFQEHNFNENILLKKRKVVNKLKLAYSNALYEFLLTYFLKENEFIKNNQGSNWIKNFGDDIYFDDHKQKWICESSIESVKLIIPQYVSDEDTLEYSISSEGNLKTLIDSYYYFRIQQFNKQILSQPSKTISDSEPDVDEDLLKKILNHFNNALKHGCGNLIREFCKQLKKI